MTKYLLLILLMSFSVATMAQADSTAYQLQRNKVNALLVQRSSKFGQYQQSLSSRTGIFGMQTKKDIKNSNEILRQITLNDNKIFREIKVLMEYKEMQVQKVQNTAVASNERIQQYMLAVKKLQDNNEALKQRAEKAESKQTTTYYIIACLVLALLATLLILTSKLRKLKKA
ncbi:hypothetical protein AAKU52_002844 [Pedobacter sp. CG_S7]|uniref:hypothetical protein n=1 Tax=Pedobacter sp. CG_S7 TaxID=3143930 RepID=UPI003392BD29